MQKRAGQSRPSKEGRELRQLRKDLAKVNNVKRADAAGVISGISAVFYKSDDPGTEYWLWSDTVERIHPGAFDRAINEAHDARALFNHDSNQLLGRVSSETCRLSVNETGLAYEIDVDNEDPDHKRVCSKIDRGDVTGSSFAFIPRKIVWEEERNDDGEWLYIRNIYDVDLFDVGPVTWPAYESTTAGRSDAGPQSKRDANIHSEYADLIAEREQQLRQADDEAVAMRVRLVDL